MSARLRKALKEEAHTSLMYTTRVVSSWHKGGGGRRASRGAVSAQKHWPDNEQATSKAG
jgi:hypothetical protein